MLKTNCMIPEYRGILNFLFGALSGVIGTTLLYPTHMIKRVFQANSKSSVLIVDDRSLTITKFIKDTFQTQGIKGLYKGLSITYVKIIPYQGLLFWSNEKLKVLLGYEKH